MRDVLATSPLALSGRHERCVSSPVKKKKKSNHTGNKPISVFSIFKDMRKLDLRVAVEKQGLTSTPTPAVDAVEKMIKATSDWAVSGLGAWNASLERESISPSSAAVPNLEAATSWAELLRTEQQI